MLLNKNEVLIDFLDIKDMKIIQRNDHFNFSLDSVLLANFARINRSTKSVLDLGTGNGAISMMLSCRTNAKIYGIEIQEISADLARRNIELNRLTNNIEIINDDMNNYIKYFKDQSQDLIVCNPPFFKLDGNEDQINNLDQLSLARHELSINLDQIIFIASKLLKNNASFSLVHRSSRLSEILETMKKYSIEPKRIQFCHSKMNKPSKIILIEGIKNSKSNLEIMPPLFTHKDNGEYSEIVKQYFKMKNIG